MSRTASAKTPAVTLWAGVALFVPLVIIANVLVEAVPRARGIGFEPLLRYAFITPACAVIAIAAAFLYRSLQQRVDRPERTFAAILFVLALLSLTLLRMAGAIALVNAAAPLALGTSLALSILVPRFVDRPRRPLGIAATAIFSLLAIAALVAAINNEPSSPPTSASASASASVSAVDIPRTMLDADHKFLDLPGGARVHYVDEGSGETLLFLHGNPAWMFQWRDLINGLRGSFRCVALDYPGFGLSTAPPGYGYTPREQSVVLEQFVDRLGLRDLTPVMQDWGGPIGLGLAGRRPELIRRVILGNTWAWPTSTSEARGMFSIIAGGPIGEFLQMNFNGIARGALSSGVVRQLPPDVRAMYLRPFAPFDRRGIAAFYPGQITAASDYFAEVEAALPRIRDREALIFWGLEDPGFPRADIDRFERAFPNHRTIEFAGANHFFFEDHASEMIAAIKAIDRHGKSAGTAP